MKPIFTTADETNRIIAFFSEIPIGQEVSFEQASSATGLAIKSTLAAYHSARRIALRDSRIVIEAIRGFGFKRLDGGEMVKKGFRTQAGIRRQARRGTKVAEVAVLQNLTRDEMANATQQLSRFAIIETTAMQRPAKTNNKLAEAPAMADNFNSRATLKGFRPANAQQ